MVWGPEDAFGAEPIFEKCRLFPKCSSSRVRTVPTATLAGALIGRDSELPMLTFLMKEVAAGQGGSALIEGEPGIRKSALVRAALAEADVGCAAVWGAGDERGQP